MQPTERFTDRAGNYAKFRPSYPEELLQFMHENFGLNDHTQIADIGSGTGIFTELLLHRNYYVLAVEPNDAMRKTAEMRLAAYSKVRHFPGSGEHTGLPDQAVSLITVAQAFHWLDPLKAKAEFNRILAPEGHIAIIWYTVSDTSAFGKAYELFKAKYGHNYTAIRKSHDPDLTAFFAPMPLRTVSFPYNMFLNLEGLKGLIHSSSFMPLPADPVYKEMVQELENLFDSFQENGLVNMEYRTSMYYTKKDK